MLYLLSYLFFPVAEAGTFTDAPGALQGDISIQNSFLQTRDSLYQSEELVGSRKMMNDHVNVVLLFGLLDFMSLKTNFPVGFQSVSFQDVHQMQFEPLEEIGTYINTPATEDYKISGSGLEGIELSLHFYPFHKKIFNERGDTGNWNVGILYRAPDNTNFYSPSESGKRGSGVGAQGFGLETSFSKRKQHLEPYLQIKGLKSSAFDGSIRTASGKTLKQSTEFQPASTVDIRGGSEFFVWEDVAMASYVTVDLFGEYHYQSFQQIPSNIYLPNVLETTWDNIITQTEVISFQGGIGTNVQLNSVYGMSLAGKVGYASPQQVEHIYPVNTLGSFQWGIFTEFKFRYRTTAS